MYQVNNAVIIAAGTSSRFAPLSFEKPKGLTEVRGEILIERQIRQLKEAGISQIVLVTGYKAEQYAYLHDQYGITLVHNPAYLTRNNHSSIYYVQNYLRNSYVCSSDNYFKKNPFTSVVDQSYYAAVYASGETNEWCLQEDQNGYISSVHVGGKDAWYMLGHTFWDETFSKSFIRILNAVYNEPETKNMLWEDIYRKHLDVLKMKIRKYPNDEIYEFDTLDELREFDPSYISNTRSVILKEIAANLNIKECDMHSFKTVKNKDNAASGFTFQANQSSYAYSYETKELKQYE